ncbi:MAG: adenosylcobinamide-GDP ribazoletransferase [Candidatus Bathyarchaeota archaeon]|nr:adenosylcobinamide-GDP ribazoletransferase [Candidatus Bathyarchaeota archaeon]
MLKAIKNLLAFLTILPVHMDMNCLVDSARFMFIFPLVGALLGLLAGVFGWAISFFLPTLVVGALTLSVLLLLSGLHHTDGLLDFGDALMCHGTPERKIEVMHDQFTGAGAIGLGLMTYVVSAFAFAGLGAAVIIQSLIVVELCAKLAMVVSCWAGRSVHKGMNSPFMEVMHGKYGTLRLVAALFLSLLVAVPLLWFAGWFVGLVVVSISVLASGVIVTIAHRHFGGVTGDVFGATNELVRMVAVVVLLAMFQ